MAETTNDRWIDDMSMMAVASLTLCGYSAVPGQSREQSVGIIGQTVAAPGQVLVRTNQREVAAIQCTPVLVKRSDNGEWHAAPLCCAREGFAAGGAGRQAQQLSLIHI